MTVSPPARQSWWASVFDKSVPTALPFEGQLPVLATDDAALSRTYCPRPPGAVKHP